MTQRRLSSQIVESPAGAEDSGVDRLLAGRAFLWLLFGCLLLGLALRTYLLVTPEAVNVWEPDAYVSDEGVVGLMGKHILEKGERPVFFYGQHYLGALEAYLVAISEHFLGYNMVALRAVPYIFSLALVAVVWLAGRIYFGHAAGAVAAILMALAPSYVMVWGLKARGGFIEHMFLSVLLLAIFGAVQLRLKRGGMLVAFGLVAGVAAWVNQLVVVFLVIMTGLLWWHRRWTRRQTALVLCTFTVGALPLLLYCARNPLLMPSKLTKKFLLVNRVAVEKRQGGERFFYGALTRASAVKDGPEKVAVVFGLPEHRESGAKGWLVLGAAPLLLFGGGTVRSALRAHRLGWGGAEGTLVILLMGVVAVGYVSSRYMLVAYPLAVLLGAGWVVTASADRRRLLVALVVLTLIFNLAGLADRVQAAGQDNASELVTALSSLGCSRGYSAGPMYHIIFRSNESVILAPLQKNRYPSYDNLVGAAPEICYVYRQDQASKRQHLRFLSLLNRVGAKHEVREVGIYRIFYRFQPRTALTEKLIREARAG